MVKQGCMADPGLARRTREENKIQQKPPQKSVGVLQPKQRAHNVLV